jgi:Domain of unknown function (DUF4091)
MRPRGVTTVIAAGLLLSSGLVFQPSAYASAPTVFQDFESDADLTGLTVSVPEVDSVARASVGTHGESSVRFTVGPANTPGATPFSAMTLQGGTASLPVTDWSGQVAAGWDFFTDLDYDVTSRLSVRDTAGRTWSSDYRIRTRGWSSFNVRISTLTAAGLDVSSIAAIALSVPRAAHPISGYYDAFRLADEFPYDQTAFGDRAASALLGLCDFAGLLDGVSDQLDELDGQVGDDGDAIDERLAALVHAQQDEVAALRAVLDAGDMDYETYATFNSGVVNAQRAAGRLANTIQARLDAPRADFGVAAADSMSLVYPKDVPFVATGPSPTLRLARGEYESLQTVVLPYAEELSDVRARVLSVRGPRGRQVDADLRVTVDPVGSLDTEPSNVYRRPVYTGWTPDPIRDDITSVDVAAADVQPYWIRIEADDDARAGRYAIRLSFSADGKRPHPIEVTARVWPFAIPDRPKLPTAFQYTPDITADTYGITDPEQKERLKHEFWSFLDDYKIQPDQIYTVDGDPAIPDGFTIRPTPVRDVLYVKRNYGLTHFNALYLWAGLLDRDRPETWKAQIDKWLEQLDTAMAAYREAGVARYAYVYGFDEATGPLLEAARQTFTAIKAEHPDLPLMTTLRDNSMGEDTGLAGPVDIWVPQQDLYDQDVAERTRARGDQAWWYPDIATGHPLPNWFNGYPPIDARMLMGPMSYQAGVEGVLYYATNHWTVSQHLEQPLVDDGIFSAYDPVTFLTTAGDGSLFYPGPDGPMASIRIENFRDGMEDYNLLWTLRRALSEHPDAPSELRKLARKLLTATDVVTAAREFTEDPAVYRDWRDQVAWVVTRLQR